MFVIEYFSLYLLALVFIVMFAMGTILRHDVHDKLQAYRAYRQRREEGNHA
jgi:hypothetical protein